MVFARVYTGGLVGVEAYRIEVEVDCSGGIGQIHIVGLPDTAVKESQERVRSAIKACDLLMPPGKKWVVNLAPADTRKEGPSYDLPIAIGMLASTGHVDGSRLGQFWMVGELSLDGGVRATTGILPLAASCRAEGFASIIIPEGNTNEGELIEGLNVYPVSHLKQVLSILGPNSDAPIMRSNARKVFERNQDKTRPIHDFSDVKGQHFAKRALMIAAAGRHNTLMVGSPGSGKSMLAQRLPGIMPPLEFTEAIELTKLYSVAGLLANKGSMITERPFRSPHHSASISGLVGGGSYPRPGEISLSHFGVLFLDELTEFPRSHIDALRQPLETGNVTISRAHQTLSYPASFLLVGACNPCPCGFRGDAFKYCTCSPYQADRYWAKLSGPFLDRIDLHVEVSRLSETELASGGGDLTSESMHMQVLFAVERQRARFAEGEPFMYNGQLGQKLLRRFCKIDEVSRDLLARAVSQLGLSARAYDRVLRIARTIADLAGVENVQMTHIAEAIRYRTIRSWGHL
jgi:magnesium chelatase family protein